MRRAALPRFQSPRAGRVARPAGALYDACMAMQETITLGPARDDELPTVVELTLAVERQHEAYWPLRWQLRPNREAGWLGWLRRHVADPDMLIVVARDETAQGGARVVGALLADIEDEMPIYTYSRYAFIHDVAVREAYRGRGIGTRLLREAVAWARQRGVDQIRLMAAEQNEGARKLFARAGFRETYREMVMPTA